MPVGKQITLMALTCAALPLIGQEQTFRAQIRGSGSSDRGKCTIEVDVDDVAEIAIEGDTGRMRTLSGQPSVWRRFQCSSPLPPSVSDFRFSGVDGRGRQTLLRDPRQNRGIAVIRIEDPQGGREGYTFDIEWQGGSSYGGGGNWGGGGGGYYNRGDVVRSCQDAVRQKADQDYGVRDLGFIEAGVQDNPGRRDFVEGTFENRRNRDRYQFSCSVDFSSGRIRSVDVTRSGGGGYGGNYGNDVVRACQDAVVNRLQGDGYRDIGFRSANGDGRSGTVTGSASARDRYGNSNFDFRCSVDNRGGVRNVEVTRR